MPDLLRYSHGSCKMAGHDVSSSRRSSVRTKWMPLGFGGIGEVCKARDTRLNRYGGVEPPTHRGHLRGGRSRASHWTWQMRAIPESAGRASIGRDTMNEIAREEALSLLIKNCGLTESE